MMLLKSNMNYMDDQVSNTPRSIKLKVKAEKVDMGGHLLDQPLPINMLQQIDPFILIHHWKDVLPAGANERSSGVGPHPHRGFSPVTIIFEGGIHHRDSLGNSQAVYAGGTQWMNAGKGITHSERPPKEIAAKGGPNEFIQFWVNSPSDAKKKPAHYQALAAEDVITIDQDDGKSKIQLIAGSLDGKTSNIKTDSPLLILRMDHAKGGSCMIPLPENYNALIYILEGEIELADGTIGKGKDMMWLRNDGYSIQYKARSKTKAILLAGAPINEPLVTHGPFVLNSQDEIMEAMRDYKMGKMGILIEDFE